MRVPVLLPVLSLALVFAQAGRGDDPAPAPAPAVKPAFNMPDAAAPSVTPSAPVGPLTVTPDVWYVFDGPARPAFALFSGDGQAAIDWSDGPQTMRGVFADAPDRVQKRTFKGKVIGEVVPVKDGQVEMILIPVGAKTEADIIRRKLIVKTGKAPQPPPAPAPTPTPTPTPTPAPDSPFPAGGLKCLIVFDPLTKTQLPPGQQAILQGRAVRDALDLACAKDGQTPGWFILPAGTDARAIGPAWDKLMSAARPSLPWVYIGGGAGRPVSEKLPQNEADFLGLVKQAQGQ